MTDEVKPAGDAGPDEFAAWFDREFGPPESGADVDDTDDARRSDTGRSDDTGRTDDTGRSGDETDELVPAPRSSVLAPPRDPEADPEAPAAPDGADGDSGDGDGTGERDATADRPFGERVVARVLRRPLRWWNAPWTNERVVRVLVTSTALVTTTVIMMMIVHLNPLSSSRDLIFDNTTPTGGDMGAHVWAPAFLRDHYLPNLQLSGWSMDWYGGLPLYRFYMVIPALAIVALDVVLPYGVAFKLVALSGLVTFPIACWAFGRLAGFRHPIPELFAFAGLTFLLDESFQIYGGNVKSTMAGEFSFSIALTLAVLGLGLLANGLRTGRYRVWSAVVLSLAAVSHGIVLIFVAVSAIILCLVWMDRSRFVYAVTTGAATLLLSAWWVGPFLFGHEYMTDMKYGFRPEGANDSFYDMFFPLASPLDFLVTTFAIVGFGAMILRRNLTGVAIGLVCLAFVGLVYLTRDSLPLIGLLWNPRLLPFVYFTRYLLMVIGIYEVLTWIVNTVRNRLATHELSAYEAAGAAGAIALSLLLVFGWMYETLPFDGEVQEGESLVYAWGPFRKGPESGRAVADGWTRYNWQGYEGRTDYPEYNAVVNTMADIGETRGCGRALWENNSANSQYGTTMALMLLPHWTDGCIASMEGLFFEASGTTPYHFLTAAAMSESSSNPVRQLRYTNNDAAVGVRHMEDLGVRYLMVRTDAAKIEAANQPELEFITTVGTWDVYEHTSASIVTPLTVQPVIVEGRSGDQRERNLELGTSWFQRRDDWPAIPADDGPDEWQRIEVAIDMDARVGEPGDRSRNVDYVLPTSAIETVVLPEVTVTDVEIRQQSISFDVDQVGVPVLVRVSYFPNWSVSGADGPYRVSPNHMVVVPTDTSVELTYGRSALDWFFYGLTALGIAFCVWMRRQGDLEYDSETPRFGTAPPTDPPRRVGDDALDASFEPPLDALRDQDGVVDATPSGVGEPVPSGGPAPPTDVGDGRGDTTGEHLEPPSESGMGHR